MSNSQIPHERSIRNTTLATKVIFASLIYTVTLAIYPVIENRYLSDAITLTSIILIFNIHLISESKRDLLSLLYPSSFGINYVYISLLIGAIGFYNDDIVVPHMKTRAPGWEHSIVPNLFLASIVACVIIFSNYTRTFAFISMHKVTPNKIVVLLSIFLAILVIFTKTAFWFGEQVLGAIFAIYILYIIGVRRAPSRIFLYIIAFIPFSFAMSHSKREAIFFLYSILILEVVIGQWGQVNFRRILLAACSMLALCGLILAVTVVRASEVYGVSSVGDIIPAALAYLRWHDFIAYFLLNIEATYTYFHVYNAIDMAATQIPLLWGETYIKPLFIWLPRDWIDWKPRSAVDIYTTIFDSRYRALGGSWAISALGEAYLNFRIFGAIICALILCSFDWIFRRCVLDTRGQGLIYSVGTIYFGIAFLTYMRGSGLDLALIQFLVVVATAVPFAMAFNYRRGVTLLYVREPITRTGKIVRHIVAVPRNGPDPVKISSFSP